MNASSRLHLSDSTSSYCRTCDERSSLIEPDRSQRRAQSANFLTKKKKKFDRKISTLSREDASDDNREFTASSRSSYGSLYNTAPSTVVGSQKESGSPLSASYHSYVSPRSPGRMSSSKVEGHDGRIAMDWDGLRVHVSFGRNGRLSERSGGRTNSTERLLSNNEGKSGLCQPMSRNRGVPDASPDINSNRTDTYEDVEDVHGRNWNSEIGSKSITSPCYSGRDGTRDGSLSGDTVTTTGRLPTTRDDTDLVDYEQCPAPRYVGVRYGTDKLRADHLRNWPKDVDGASIKTSTTLKDEKDASTNTLGAASDVGSMAAILTKLGNEKRAAVKEAHRNRIFILVVTFISLFVLVILGTTSLVISIQHNNTGNFAFALAALLDSADSFVIIWRFFGKHTLQSERKEKIACVILAIMGILSAGALVARGTLAFVDETLRSDTDAELWHLAAADGVICLMLCVLKCYLAKKLRSLAVVTDALNSGVGALLSFAVVISQQVASIDPDIWYMDPILGFLSTTIFIGYSTWLLYEQLCRKKFRKPEDDSPETIP